MFQWSFLFPSCRFKSLPKSLSGSYFRSQFKAADFFAGLNLRTTKSAESYASSVFKSIEHEINPGGFSQVLPYIGELGDKSDKIISNVQCSPLPSSFIFSHFIGVRWQSL